MFFEHTKRQGGGPVKDVYLNKKDRIAVIVFKETDAVDAVLKKQPIHMLGTKVEVEVHTPYLEDGESLKSIEISGIQDEITKDLAKLKRSDCPEKAGPRWDLSSLVCLGCADEISEGELLFKCRCCEDANICFDCFPIYDHDPTHIFTFLDPGKSRLRSIHEDVACDACNEDPIIGVRYKCIDCDNFDFCATCKAIKEHDPMHTFILVV